MDGLHWLILIVIIYNYITVILSYFIIYYNYCDEGDGEPEICNKLMELFEEG